MSDSFDRVVDCFRKSVPLIAYDTADQRHTSAMLRERFLMASKMNPADPLSKPMKKVCVIDWDVASGVTTESKDADALAIVSNLGGKDAAYNPVNVLEKVASASGRFVLLMHNIHRFIDDVVTMQYISNLRDALKVSDIDNRRSLVLLGVGLRMPVELSNDVVSIDEPLPSPSELEGVMRGLIEAQEETSDPTLVTDAARAGVGLTAFAAENLATLAYTRDGLQVKDLWLNKIKKINQTPGLQVVSSGDFDSIGGVQVAKRFLKQLLNGKEKPNCIVYIDEIEKALGGLSGDTSGTTQDQLGVLLQYMQDKSASGAIFYGPPGAAKSALAKAAGVEGGIPTIQLDLGAAKGSLVGQSEQQIREALKVIDAVSGGKTLWLATCNSMAIIPPELRRRFKYGTWFFDLPDLEERTKIWEIYAKKFEIGDYSDLLSRDWTGAEIENCCVLSDRLGISVTEAAEYVVPVSTHSKDMIEGLRESAEGKLLSASNPGVYVRESRETKLIAKRTIE